MSADHDMRIMLLEEEIRCLRLALAERFVTGEPTEFGPGPVGAGHLSIYVKGGPTRDAILASPLDYRLDAVGLRVIQRDKSGTPTQIDHYPVSLIDRVTWRGKP